MIKKLLYISIFISGLCSLAYQVIWQKYLSVLVGSEARSSTLVVATFLIGLAVGYYIFGLISPKMQSRNVLLKFYGWVEMLTGLYACLFPKTFQLVFNSQIAQTNNFIIHLILTFLLIIPPTILMGATIPCMTAVLPENDENVSDTHSKIYGVNTLGAFLGCLLSGFVIVPELGLETSLIIVGVVNCMFAFVYIFNNLKGQIQEKIQPLNIENQFSQKILLLMSFIIGMITLATEVLWFRILGLAIGSSYLIFPIVVSIYILGIGFGSLTIKELSQKKFVENLIITILLMVATYMLAPYLALTLSNLRIMFKSFELSFYIYHLIVYIILLLLIGPGIFFSGRIVPYIYSLMFKKPESFSREVGFLYFINTLGTFLGATLFGYLLLNYFQIEIIYKYTLIILILTSGYFFFKANEYKYKIISAVILFALLAFNFKRAFHDMGLFRFQNPLSDVHFKNILNVVDNFSKKNRIYFRDDPNTTVAVIENNKSTNDYSVYVNGKSDGSTFGDFSTVALLGMLPVSIVEASSQKHAIIGVGTGITAGLVATFEKVDKVDLIEISEAILEGTKKIPQVNFDYSNNKKISIHQMDAFQFFKGRIDKYDVIISEPSNPWVNGIENLYTLYFYNEVLKNISEDGVFVQWAHTYSVDKDVIYTIISNLGRVFKNVRAFITSEGDIAFVARKSKKEIIFNTVNDKNFNEKLSILGFDNVREFDLLEVLNPEEFNYIASLNNHFEHDVFYPKLSVRSYKNFWIGVNFRVNEWLDPYAARYFSDKLPLKNSFINKVAKSECKSNKLDAFCTLVSSKYKDHIKIFSGNGDFGERLVAYSILRKDKFISQNERFLIDAGISAMNLKNKDLFNLVIQEFIKDGETKRFKELIGLAKRKLFIEEKEAIKLYEVLNSLESSNMNK